MTPRSQMTLRRRFTLAVAGAVAAVALAITAVAFIVVRADLQNQVKHELRQQAAVVERLARHYHGHIPAGWVPRDSGGFGASSAYAQVVTARDAVWAPAGDGGLLPGTAAAAQVAAGQRGSYYAEVTINGVHAMVLTTPVAPGLAVQLAVPLSAVDTELGRIGATLALLSAAGVGLAALAGWGVARAGLAPVGRLAAVAEQVTATGDPGRRVEVDRADELGRLAASFNTMLGALQRSLAAQRQLVSDASHELRTPLTSLRINSELLAADPGLPEAERQEILDRVVAQVAELSQLVAGVTELARGDEPSPPEDSIPPDLAGSLPRGLHPPGPPWQRPRGLHRPGSPWQQLPGGPIPPDPLWPSRRGLRRGGLRRGSRRRAGRRPPGLATDRVHRGPGAMPGLRPRRAAQDRGPEPAGQRGEVRPARRPGRGPPAGRRAHRARSRTRDPAR